MVINFVKTKNSTVLIQKVLFILLQRTQSNSWLLPKFLVYLCIVVINVIIRLILFCRYVLNEFICWSCYVIWVCSSHNSIQSATSL